MDHQPPPPTPPTPSRWPGAWRLFIGLFIILIGLSFLASQLGWTWLDPNVVWKLWPLFIIVAGVSIVLRGRVSHSVLGLIIGIVTVGAVAAVMLAPSQPVSTDTEEIARLAEAESADVRFDLGAAKAEIRGGSDRLVDASLVSNAADLTSESSISGDVQTARVKMEGRGGWWFLGNENTFDARLNENLPLTIDVNSGAADMQFDFSSLQVRNLSIDTGASSLDLKLGDRLETSRVDINAGASSIDVSIPRTVGVKLRLDAGVSSTSLPDFDEKEKHIYESRNFSQFAKTIDISVSAGVSSITFTWY